jgi:hypothetical protein
LHCFENEKSALVLEPVRRLKMPGRSPALCDGVAQASALSRTDWLTKRRKWSEIPRAQR